jgi:glycosyltransferase involved in cell wall biosynthesis
MKKPNQVNKNDVMHIGFTSPGWPLEAFPNGIVAYVQTMRSGFESDLKPVVLAAPLIGVEVKNQLINISKFPVNQGFLHRVADSLLYRLKLPFAKSLRYQIISAVNALKIHLGIKELENPLDIVEMEESFGTAHSLMKINDVPIVTRLHGPWAVIGPILNMQDNWDFKLRVFYEGEAIKNSLGVTAPSVDVLDRVRKYYNLSLPNAKVIPNPVQEVSKGNQWQYDANRKPFVLFVGRFDAVKGGDLILQAFRHIALINKEIELMFVGPDRSMHIAGEDFTFNDYVNRFIPEEHIKQRIQFLGLCNSEAIAELRKNSLVTIVCSRYEVFSISLTEALSAGCPTVATSVGGMKEIVKHGYNALLAEPDSPESIAKNVLALIENPEKMQILSRNAIEDCKKRFSPKIVAAQTVEYYKSVLAGRA